MLIKLEYVIFVYTDEAHFVVPFVSSPWYFSFFHSFFFSQWMFATSDSFSYLFGVSDEGKNSGCIC